MTGKEKKHQALIESPGQVLRDLFLIISGSLISAVAINGILIPQHFVTGGVTGLAMILNSKIPFLKLEWIYFLMNIPLFAMAWMAVGRRFFFYSIIGMIALSMSVAFVHVQINLQDRMLSALLAGIIIGTGTGITLKSSGSQGGMDILSIMLLKRYSISLGNTILTLNFIVLALVAFFYSLEALLYTLIVLYVSSKIVNIIVSGLSQRKSVIIISSKWKEISDEILKDIRRGVTIIQGRGGYTGNNENVIYTVVTLPELGAMKNIINRLDPNAFVVINNTLEVINYRIGNQPHW